MFNNRILLHPRQIIYCKNAWHSDKVLVAVEQQVTFFFIEIEIVIKGCNSQTKKPLFNTVRKLLSTGVRWLQPWKIGHVVTEGTIEEFNID